MCVGELLENRVGASFAAEQRVKLQQQHLQVKIIVVSLGVTKGLSLKNNTSSTGQNYTRGERNQNPRVTSPYCPRVADNVGPNTRRPHLRQDL